MIDFPANPTNGQIFIAPNGVTYVWNGVTWTSQGYGQGISDAPADNKTYGRRNNAWIDVLAAGGWIISNPTANDILASLVAPGTTDGSSVARLESKGAGYLGFQLVKDGAQAGALAILGTNVIISTGTTETARFGTTQVYFNSCTDMFLRRFTAGDVRLGIQPQTTSGNSILELGRIAASSSGLIQVTGTNNAGIRWRHYFGTVAETGSDAGCDVIFERFSDASTSLGNVLRLVRKNGYMLLGKGTARAAALTNTDSDVAIEFSKSVATANCRLTSNTNGVLRWSMDLGNGEAETGSNAGSNFALTRFSDAGGVIDQVLKINRDSGYITWIGTGMNINGNAMVSPPDWTTIQVRAKLNSGLEMFANSTAGGNLIAAFVGPPASGRRWNCWFGDGAEGANNAGSNLNFQAMDNSGNYLRSAMILYRDSGEARFAAAVRCGTYCIANTFLGQAGNSWIIQGQGDPYIEGEYRRVFIVENGNIGDTLQWLGYHRPGIETFYRFLVGGSGNYFEMRNNGVGYSQGGWNSSSDGRVKINRSVIENALDKLLAITGYVYDKLSPMGEVNREAGIIAQDVEAVLPETVTLMDTATTALEGAEHVYTDFRAMNYNGVTALLVNAVKELSGKLDAAMARIAQLEAT